MLIKKLYEVKWNTNNIKHYRNLGYTFTFKNDTFLVPVEHLPSNSGIFVDIECDFCGRVHERKLKNYTKTKNLNYTDKDSCEYCLSIRKKNTLQTKFSDGNLDINTDGYWTMKVNRMNELKAYVKKNGHANVMIDPTSKSLKLAIERYDGNIMHLLYELGYENPIKLINHKLPYYFDSIENVIREIQNFINREGHFPNTQELTYDLKISTRNTSKHGGIYEIRRIMGYEDTNAYVDDRGFFNKSYYEFVVAQYLINNTSIEFKREQMPFPKDEGKFRSDFTFFVSDTPYHIEVWGYPVADERHRIKYNKRKQQKLKLYKKYNINVIGIDAEIFLNRTIDNIQDSLHKIFNEYIHLNTLKLNNEIFFNPKMSDKEIFDVLMTYSENGEILPKAPALKKTEGYKFYKEAVKRYGSYQLFAEKFNSNVHHRRNYWDMDKIHEYVLRLIKDGEYVIRPNLRKLGLNCLESAISSRGDIIQVKLDVYENNVESIHYIHPKELKFLNNVASNRGTNIKGKVTSKQQKQALLILKKLKVAN